MARHVMLAPVHCFQNEVDYFDTGVSKNLWPRQNKQGKLAPVKCI
jgi:hypothetical protein